MALRDEFPPAGSDYLGGQSDGYCYRTAFEGTTLAHSYQMLKAFLKEEGYGDVPLPRDVEELLWFRLPIRRRQTLLFYDNGYVHNPVKILFPSDRRLKRRLILEIYDEKHPQHLLRFHRKVEC